MAVKLTDEEARNLARTEAAALIRSWDLAQFYGGETFAKFENSLAACKRLEKARQWIARHIEDAV